LNEWGQCTAGVPSTITTARSVTVPELPPPVLVRGDGASEVVFEEASDNARGVLGIFDRLHHGGLRRSLHRLKAIAEWKSVATRPPEIASGVAMIHWRVVEFALAGDPQGVDFKW
jgi:hypothetical protein